MWYNPVIIAILHSPVHGLLSRHMLTLTYTGHTSGLERTIPVSYLREGDRLTVMSFRQRTWWRNFRDGADVTLRLCGTTVPATAQAITDGDVVLPRHLTTLLSTHPRYARSVGIALDPDGMPNPSAVLRAARTYVLVHLSLARALDTSPEPHTEASSYGH
jgi:hypothetical protein